MSEDSNIKSAPISFNDEQVMLLDTAMSFCREKSSVARVRDLLLSDSGYDAGIWQEIVALGWTGIAIPEEFGGSELGVNALVPIAETMGRFLLTTPFISTTLASQMILQGASEEQKTRWLPGICEGLIASIAITEDEGSWDLEDIRCKAIAHEDVLHLSGSKTFVFDARKADIFVVSVMYEGMPALVVLEKDQLNENALRREVIIDETRRSFRLTLDGVQVKTRNMLPAGNTISTLAHLNMLANLLLSAELAGGTAAVLNVVIEYLTTRKQFDRLIGSYQSLKHPTVEILLGLESMRSLVYHAATVWDEQQREVAVRMAKAQACEAAIFAGDRAVQFHGGFGFTYECDAQLYLRRALCSQLLFGDAAHHRKHLAPLLLS